jgi:hypothetical protein
VTVDESRREHFQSGHLLVCGRRPVLEQVSLAILRADGILRIADFD